MKDINSKSEIDAFVKENPSMFKRLLSQTALSQIGDKDSDFL